MALKVPHPDFLEQILNRRQILEWMAYERLRPFGVEWDDYRSAVQSAWSQSPWAPEGTEHNPKDFMPKWNSGPEQKSEAQQIVDKIQDLMNGS